jgi:hypothetical protein
MPLPLFVHAHIKCNNTHTTTMCTIMMHTLTAMSPFSHNHRLPHSTALGDSCAQEEYQQLLLTEAKWQEFLSQLPSECANQPCPNTANPQQPLKYCAQCKKVHYSMFISNYISMLILFIKHIRERKCLCAGQLASEPT